MEAFNDIPFFNRPKSGELAFLTAQKCSALSLQTSQPYVFKGPPRHTSIHPGQIGILTIYHILCSPTIYRFPWNSWGVPYFPKPFTATGRVHEVATKKMTFPIGSRYGIFTYIYHKHQPNVGKYAIHGWYGFDQSKHLTFTPPQTSRSTWMTPSFTFTYMSPTNFSNHHGHYLMKWATKKTLTTFHENSGLFSKGCL